MSNNTTRWVLWISLILVLPLPFFSGHFSLMTTAYLLKYFFRSIISANNNELSSMPIALTLQMLLALVETWLLAQFYTVWSKNWQSNIRGSIMGLTIFSLLIIFSSVPVYDSLTDMSKLTFLQVYQ